MNMRFLQSYIRAALFREASPPNWIGRVQAVTANSEAVPMMIDGVQYLLGFTAPDYGNGDGNFDACIIKNVDGSDFLSILDHRNVWLMSGLEASDSADGAQPICEVDSAVYLGNASFSAMLCQAFLRYFYLHPQVTQYFFIAKKMVASFLQEKVFPLLTQENPKILVMPIYEIMQPRYGFALISTNGGHHG
jgi:hypothetical protein